MAFSMSTGTLSGYENTLGGEGLASTPCFLSWLRHGDPDCSSVHVIV